MRLKNKVAIITGAGRGIGLATAKLFLQEGAKVTLSDIDMAALREAEHALVGQAAAYVCADVADTDQVKSLVDKTVEAFGQLDIVFCNAGIGGQQHFFWEYPEAEFEAMLDIHVKGSWLTMKHAMPALIKAGGGSIIVTSSLAGLVGMPKGIAYSAAKHALVGVAKSAAVEAARYQVRVNTIHPGPVETDMVRTLEAGISPKDPLLGRERLEKSIPMRRYATAEEVAQLALFLASDDSRYITGTEHRIDGGRLAV
jgi:NAD(P)-dependent dehydrogenase (short-subunit alcohol dehydrogenase family)